MRRLIMLAAAIGILDAAHSFAQADAAMDMQRCIWSCLANSSGNQDPRYHACVDRVCSPKGRPAASPPKAIIPSAEQSCIRTAGREEAQKLARQCMQISEATPPPCNAENPCYMMADEIKRSCALKQSLGIALPQFCDQPASRTAIGTPENDFASIREAQAYLNALGYEAGPVDGVLGNETRRAIQRFQRVENLPSTGELTPETLRALGRVHQAFLDSRPPPPPPTRSTSVERNLPALGSSADNGRQWLGSTGRDYALVLYGTPHTDDVLISFRCNRATKTIAMVNMFEPMGARDGMRIDMELISEGGRLTLNATGSRVMLNDAFVLEATTKDGVALSRVLSGRGTLSIRVRNGIQRIPLVGSQAHVAELIEACR